MKLLQNTKLSKAELTALEKMKKMKEDLATGIENVMKPAVETPEEREARCRGMKVTLGGLVLSFDDVLQLFEKTQTVAEKLEDHRVDERDRAEARRLVAKREGDEMDQVSGEDGEKKSGENKKKEFNRSTSAVMDRMTSMKGQLMEIVALASEETEEEKSFVPPNPVEPLQLAIHAVDIVGWYPEAQIVDERNVEMSMGEEKADLIETRARVTQVEVNVGTLRQLTEAAEQNEKKAEHLAELVEQFTEYRNRKQMHFSGKITGEGGGSPAGSPSVPKKPSGAASEASAAAASVRGDAAAQSEKSDAEFTAKSDAASKKSSSSRRSLFGMGSKK